MSLIALRRWVPLLACVLLTLTSLMAIGVVCTCSSDHSLQSIQKVVEGGVGGMVAVIEVWSVWLLAVSVLLVWLLVGKTEARGRASPERLQRFLF